jgi:L-alanine-DL-glutamate epimerase-like enolase superfamily enzyme
MRITTIDFEEREFQLREPYTIAYETISQTTNFILRLYTDQDIQGVGCAAPDPVVTGESPADLRRVLRDIISPALQGADPFQYTRLLETLKPLLGPSALAMVDMALHDLVAKRAGVPVYRLLGGYRDRIMTSVTIGICSLSDTLQQARTFLQMGFRVLKLKGGLEVEADIVKLEQLRRLYPGLPLRFDANQGYDLAAAQHFVQHTADLQIEIFEQPVPIGQEAVLADLIGRTKIPVMADESLKTLQDAFHLTSMGYSDMINIKLMKVGGIQAAQHINSVAKAAQNEVMVGCLDECGLGIAGGLHFALSRPNVEFTDLDGHLDLLEDPFWDLFQLEDGCWVPNGKPGFGIG